VLGFFRPRDDRGLIRDAPAFLKPFVESSVTIVVIAKAF